ncbi:LysM peptidoglycan-binding domain-containing protein [Candidatus Methylacidithermus pantelleriae]|uniref:LysM peptidoglycan-binding domain-containing protein n=1 Tax=Candidatus Methylacidithermus pantelleriae TaxID=2744239 RepID=UPI00157C202C|nr:LysM peptidoglycan-binding domain-containing protein [Candidatus Methylacidithermus pantelleriae]
MPSEAPTSPPSSTTPPKEETGTTYTVRSGDSLWKIARKFKVTVEDLKEANGLKSDLLHPGDVLKIPAKAKATAEKKEKKSSTAPKGKKRQTRPKTSGRSSLPRTSLSRANRPKEFFPLSPSNVSPEAPRKRHVLEKSPSLGNRIYWETRRIAARGIAYGDRLRAPSGKGQWVMDCSNTARYLYWKVMGVDLGRTASDQYERLKTLGRAWEVPKGVAGSSGTHFLDQTLQPGDLIFWERTYRPKRKSPVTHVMIFLAARRDGKWIMAGSQTSRGGLFNPRHSGPDVYIVDPRRPMGAYGRFFGLFGRVRGRLFAYARPCAGTSEGRVALHTVRHASPFSPDP